jgi:lysine 2,3-aminomutase
VTPEARRGCDRLRLRGMPINNHAVLLKGVNDSLATQRELCRALLRIKVRPYYLFHCDPVTGAGHFRTQVWKGIEIIEGLRGHISGLGVPTYVVDAPRGGGKIPLMPNYLLSASNDSVVLRNYEGMIVHYHPTGEASPPLEPVETQGVSGLLEGHAEVLIPEGTPRLIRRRARVPANGNGNGKKNGYANGNGGSVGDGK